MIEKTNGEQNDYREPAPLLLSFCTKNLALWMTQAKGVYKLEGNQSLTCAVLYKLDGLE